MMVFDQWLNLIRKHLTKNTKTSWGCQRGNLSVLKSLANQKAKKYLKSGKNVVVPFRVGEW